MTSNPIVWAIDPLQDNPRVWKRSKELAACISRTLSQSLQPVYVSDVNFIPPKSQTLKEKQEREKTAASLRLKRLLKPISDLEIDEPKVLQTYGFSSENEAKKVNRYALNVRTPLILAATEGRGGLERFVEGSFVESLVAKSRVPVILVNRQTRPIQELRKIVFVTDLSRSSNRAFKKICDLASIANAQIEILSILPDYSSLAPATAASMGVGLAEMLMADEAKKRLDRTSRRLLRVGKEMGLEVTYKLEASNSKSVASAVLESESVATADLLAIAVTSDTRKFRVFGSTLQELIRRSPVPVWTCHIRNRA